MKKVNSGNRMRNGLHSKIFLLLFKTNLFFILLKHLRSWRKTIATARKIKEKIKIYRGPKAIQKVAYVDGLYYWDMYSPGWPSKGFQQNVKRECEQINSLENHHVGMRNVLFGITTQCPLQCEHCYEWNNLNKKEKLSFSDLQSVIEKLIDYGVHQIHFGGGEPMMRYTEIIALLKSYSKQAGFWMVTSGYNVNEDRALQLKQAGLTGMCVSLDHHEESKHNEFRHHRKAFTMAQNAVAAANHAGLVTTLSLCATKEFVDSRNLHEYLELAKQWKVSFIQILEPRAVGHFEGKAVQLSIEQKKLLNAFFLQVNSEKSFKTDPIIIYHEYYRSTIGCRGAGKGSFYIDPLGEVMACPFCRNSAGNLLVDSVEQCVNNLLSNGCAMSATTTPISNQTKLQEFFTN